MANTASKEYPAPDACGASFSEYINRSLPRFFVDEARALQTTPDDLGNERGWQKMLRAWAMLIKGEPKESRFNSSEFERQFHATKDKEATSTDFNYLKMWAELELDLGRVGFYRRLFRTSKGYLGIGALSLRIDDEL